MTPTSDQSVDVAFVTVNYNTRGLLEEMVGFFRSTPLPFSHRLTVVDNASTDGSLDFLASCPEVTTLCNGENAGYGRAINRGVAASRSKYVCALNTDVVLNTDALAAMHGHLESHPQTGVVAPRICYPDGRTQGFLFCDGIVPLYSTLVAKLLAKHHKLRVERARRPLRVDGVLGALVFLRRQLCPDGKLFDEDFFFYFEDSDLARRLAKQGVRCEVLPDQSIVHLGGASTSVRNGIQYYRSKYLYVRKQFGPRHASALRAIDRFRIGRKVFCYRILQAIRPSNKTASKLELYRSVLRMLEDTTGPSCLSNNSLTAAKTISTVNSRMQR
jgi:N-acetylglucosaminyl-diphospho-decaprenol L-rhamnosyltransferase